jgi:hypothetical protein
MKSAIRETHLQNLEGNLVELKERGKKGKRSFLKKQLQKHATNRMVVGSSPGEVTDFFFFFFSLLNPTGRIRPWGLLSL